MNNQYQAIFHAPIFFESIASMRNLISLLCTASVFNDEKQKNDQNYRCEGGERINNSFFFSLLEITDRGEFFSSIKRKATINVADVKCLVHRTSAC